MTKQEQLCAFEVGKQDPKRCPGFGTAPYCKFNPKRGLLAFINTVKSEVEN